MADKVKVWFDAEADYLEVRFSDAAGYSETRESSVAQRRRRQAQFSQLKIAAHPPSSRLRPPPEGRCRSHHQRLQFMHRKRLMIEGSSAARAAAPGRSRVAKGRRE
jgi:hypothetical protein